MIGKFEKKVEGLVLQFGGEPGGIWVRSKARKPSECAVSGKPIEPGDSVYRPLSNAGGRHRRVLAAAMDKIT